MPRRATMALLSAALLLASVCHVEAAGSPKDEQFRPAPHAEAVAAASTTRIAGALHHRPHLYAHQAVPVAPFEPRTAQSVVALLRHREGALPPTRQRYRRVVHDDGSEPPA